MNSLNKAVHPVKLFAFAAVQVGVSPKNRQKTMNMRILLVAGLFTLVGCTSNMTSEPGYYTLNLDRTQLCYSGNSNCLNLELIYPSHNEHQIARAYQLPSTSESWNVRQLVKLMLAPPGKQYEVKQISDFSYLIPRNVATNSVWYHLEREQYDLYESNGRSFR